MKTPKSQLLEDEKLIRSCGGGPASFLGSKGGNVYLTNKRIFHESLIGNNISVSVYLKDIAECRIERLSSIVFFIPILKTVNIYKKNGLKVRFNVSDKSGWTVAIKKYIKENDYFSNTGCAKKQDRMKKLILKGVWTQDLVIKAIKKGFNSTNLKGISQNKNGNIFLISGLNKLKVILKPKGKDTVFDTRMTFPFGWSPLGWVLIIPSALLFGAYFIGAIPIVILWIISFYQEKNFNKEVFDYLNSLEIDSISDNDNSIFQQKTKDSEVKKDHNSEIFAKIEKLGRLENEGILTQEEFQTKKTELLKAI